MILILAPFLLILKFSTQTETKPLIEVVQNLSLLCLNSPQDNHASN